MAAYTWELDRDIGLAAARGDLVEYNRLLEQLAAYQRSCTHVQNPERAYPRCYKCGYAIGSEQKVTPPQALLDLKPGLVKIVGVSSDGVARRTG